MKMQKPTLPKFEISNFQKLDENAETDPAKIWNFEFSKIGFRDNENSGHRNQNFDKFY